ncbi:MAG: UDP-N-acetylmuramoyl-tripeptide--D-alanyl-D-alanine ligase [Patescibacteria group bacterium]
MKKAVLSLVQRYLQFLARIKIRWIRPEIIAVTGSYGKTSAKEAIFQVLHAEFGDDIGKNWGNMNSVLGLPLAILGFRSYYFSLGILWNVFVAQLNLFFYRLPKILVLELGIDKPGEMSELLSIIQPNIAAVTGISETHLEGLKTIEVVKKEKNLLFAALGRNGVALINWDNDHSRNLFIPEGVKKFTFGTTITGTKSADVLASDIKVTDLGTTFIMDLFGEKINIKSKLYGAHSIKSLLIAAAVGYQYGISAEKIKKVIEQIEPQKGRMNLLKIENGIVIIDDSYNSNPRSAEKALWTLKDIKYDSARKIAILGNMNELGSYSQEGHLRVGKTAADIADLLLAVGENRKYIAEGAEKAGLSASKIRVFETTEDLIDKIDGILQPNDLVLVKGSQNGVRLEKLVKHLINNDKLASEILCRQEKKWQGK